MKTKCTIFFLILFNSTLLAQPPAEINKRYNAKQILTSITTAANFAKNILIDAEGKSKCDYEWTTGKWEIYEPAWHTGQVIFGLLEVYKITGNKTYLQKAIVAGNWWKTLAIKNHPSLTGFMSALHFGEVKDDLINFTTIADGTPGLFELSRITGNKSYADVATNAGNWAIQNLYIEKEQLLYDIIDVKTGEIWKRKSPHYEGENLPLSLLARPNNEGFLFGDMYKHTKDAKHLQVFKNLSDGLVKKQSDNGFWMDSHPNNKEQKKIHPRFNIWNAESLLKAFEITNDSSYLLAALKTARAITKWQQKDGTIYYTNKTDGSIDKSSICGSAVAFAGLLWLKLSQLGYTEFNKNISLAVNFIVANQFSNTHTDSNVRGAYFETWQKNSDGKTKIYMRDIATSFGLRFMCAYYNTLMKAR